LTACKPIQTPAIRTRGIPKPRPTPRPTFRDVESEFELLFLRAVEPLLEGAVEVGLVGLELVEDIEEEVGGNDDEEVDAVEVLAAFPLVILK
jgi:hypothetical protein